jgi:hypothetical protein
MFECTKFEDAWVRATDVTSNALHDFADPARWYEFFRELANN